MVQRVPPPGAALGDHLATLPDAAASGQRVSRRTALALSGGLMLVLGIGWLADALATVPGRLTASGPLAREAGIYRVQLTFTPAVPLAGRLTALVASLTDATGAPVADARVRFTPAMPAMDMALPALSAHLLGSGRYTGALAFPMSGDWTVEVAVSVQGQAAAMARFPVSVR